MQYEERSGVSERSVRNYRLITRSVFEWLPDDKIITKQRLASWRQTIKSHGYSPNTERNYVKGINRYLGFIGRPDLRFNRGRSEDLAGKQFGYLTAIEPTGEKDRKDIVWRCICQCGREVAYPATRLLQGNTASCGCLRGQHLRRANKYMDGTSLRQSIEEQVYSVRAKSGYTGVTMKRGKWKAYIKYKGKTISLGCYTDLEEAVKARARGKELVQMDALGLLNVYEALSSCDPCLPDRGQIKARNRAREWECPKPAAIRSVRSNNTSGCPGVFRKRNKWAAKITWQKVTYQLGSYTDIASAIAARQEAERLLAAEPREFLEQYWKRKEMKL